MKTTKTRYRRKTTENYSTIPIKLKCAPAHSGASLDTIQSLRQPRQYWRGHTNTPQNSMRQQKKSSKNAH
jgi:hypothetical protein